MSHSCICYSTLPIEYLAKEGLLVAGTMHNVLNNKTYHVSHESVHWFEQV